MKPAVNDVLYYVDLDAAARHAAAFTPRERAVLETINQKIGARESVESIVDFLAAATRDVSPCDRLGVTFLEEEGRRLRAHYAKALYEPVLLTKGYGEDLAGSSLAAVLERGVPRIINDLEAYLARRPESRSTQILTREGVRSSMACPLSVDGRTVGLLFRSARQPGACDAHQAALHLAVAERLSQAVEKAYRIEQLAEANRAYYEMLGFVTHELKSPLASIITEGSLLLDGFVGTLNGEQRECLGRMTRRGRHLLRLVGDYLELARLEGGRLRVQSLSAADFVALALAPAIEVVGPQLDEQDIELERVLPHEPVRGDFDPNLLKIVLVNLLDNAIKYGREHGRIRVTVSAATDRLSLAVWNEGDGWPAQQQERLFRRFSRLQTPELLKKRGTGVGLYTVWRIVQAHGGRVTAASEHGRWAEFRVDIPQPLPAGTEPAS
jgi:signal transduction histidine kinase